MSVRTRRSLLATVLLVSATAIACEQGKSARELNDQSVMISRSSSVAADTAYASVQVRAPRPHAGRPGSRSEAVGVTAAAAPAAETDAVRSGSAEEEPAPQVPAASQQDVTPGSMLVRTGQASLQVDSLEVGIARVREVARRTGAIIANTSMEGGRDQTRAATLELRIPSAHFDEAVNGLAPIGKLESVNVSVEDVGEEYVDVQARVANARRLEQRLVELLANRTGKLSDVLTVERELARVREEIERYEGRMRYLRTRASVSTLSIAVHEPLPIVADRPGTHPMRDAFVQAWRNLVGVSAGIIASLGAILPLGIVVLLLALAARRWLPGRSFGLTTKEGGARSA